MEQHVRKQLANVEQEAEKQGDEQEARNQEAANNKELPLTETPDVKSIADIVTAIKAGDSEFLKVASEIGEKFASLVDNMSDIQLRITNIDTSLEQIQLTNLTIFDKLAKIGMAFVTFVAKFGTKKNVDEAMDEVEAEEVKKE